jgi:hypothetical protein
MDSAGLHFPSRHPALTELPGVVRACGERTEPEHITTAPNGGVQAGSDDAERHGCDGSRKAYEPSR